MAHKAAYMIRSKSNIINTQSHLSENLSLTHRQDRFKLSKDDIRNYLERNDKCKLDSDNNDDENDKNDKIQDDDDEYKDVDDQKSEVSAICEKFGGRKKTLRGHKVKMSPKSKFSPYSNVKRIKIKKNLTKNDQEASLLPKSSEKFKVEKLFTNSSKVSSIVAAIENNIAKYDGAIGVDDKKEKKMVENAFHKLMNAKNRGETTPSPGPKKRRKRLGSNKPHGLKDLDDWLRK